MQPDLCVTCQKLLAGHKAKLRLPRMALQCPNLQTAWIIHGGCTSHLTGMSLLQRPTPFPTVLQKRMGKQPEIKVLIVFFFYAMPIIMAFLKEGSYFYPD